MRTNDNEGVKFCKSPSTIFIQHQKNRKQFKHRFIFAFYIRKGNKNIFYQSFTQDRLVQIKSTQKIGLQAAVIMKNTIQIQNIHNIKFKVQIAHEKINEESG